MLDNGWIPEVRCYLHCRGVVFAHNCLIDLHVVREMLMQQLGMDFARAASDTQSGYVSARVSALSLHAG